MGRLPDGTLNPSVVYSSYMRQRPVPHKSIYAAGSTTTAAAASAPSSTTTPTTLITPVCTTTTATDSSTNTSSSTATPSTTTPTSSSSHKSVHPASTVVTEPMPIEKEAADYLRSEGVQRVVVGHQPIGDAPLFMQAHEVQVIV